MKRAALAVAVGGLLAALLAGPAAAGEGGPGDQTIYRYVNARGRPVFVNGRARIPERLRARARPVDLSAVSLNKELAAEIEEQVRQFDERRTEREEQARAGRTASGRPELRLHGPPPPREVGALAWLKRLWAGYDYLIVIAGVLLLMVAFTPYVVRRIEPDRWVRVLMLVLPLLASLGILTYAMTRTAAMTAELAATAPELSPQDVGRTGEGGDREFTRDRGGWIVRRGAAGAGGAGSGEATEPGTVSRLRQLLDQLEAQRQRALREAK